MDNLQFIQRLYNGKNCYSDSMSDEQISLLHIKSGVETVIEKMVYEKRVVFLTGNPGDGKTFIIRALKSCLENVYVVTDFNSVTSQELELVMDAIYDCYINGKPCVIAVNEFPFHKLTNRFKHKYPALCCELVGIKKNVLVFGYPSVELRRICIVDLNERNLLDKDRCISKHILNRFTELLMPYCGSNRILAHNVRALTDPLVQKQLLDIFTYIAMSGEHFVIRDILGTLSYILVSCTDMDADTSGYYFDSLFSNGNDFMTFATQFDPVLLTSPSWDEKLWNGEITEGWRFDCPAEWPCQITKGTGSVEEATQLFKSIKRKFYFENVFAKALSELQPQDFRECIDVFARIKQDKKRIKRMLISSMNKLFLSTDDENDKLRSWTTHSYDLSRSPGAAVSTRYIDADDLDLAYPEPVIWLKEMEYSPAYLVMLSQSYPEVKLEISIDLLRSLIMIKNGYPAALLSSQYEQVVSQFIQALCSVGVARDYRDGEMLISNRKEGTLKRLRIEDGKYYLGSEVFD